MGRTSRSNYVQKMEDGTFWRVETPTGAINGSNKTFTLSDSPNPADEAELEVNGQTVDYTNAFTISGDTLTTVRAYPTGVTLVIRFRIEPL